MIRTKYWHECHLIHFQGKGQKCEDRLAPETPTFHQIPESEKRRRKVVKMAKEQRNKVLINETPLKFQFDRMPGYYLF